MSDKDIFIGVRFGIAAIRRLASIKIDLGSFELYQLILNTNSKSKHVILKSNMQNALA